MRTSLFVKLVHSSTSLFPAHFHFFVLAKPSGLPNTLNRNNNKLDNLLLGQRDGKDPWKGAIATSRRRGRRRWSWRPT